VIFRADGASLFLPQVTLIEQNHMVEEGNPKIADLLAKTATQVSPRSSPRHSIY
jgi:hypothetical protein